MWRMSLLILSIGFVFLDKPVSPAVVRATEPGLHLAAAAPFELVVWPDKLWQAGSTSTQMVIGLKGKSGFSGNVTVNVTGLPPAQGGGINGQITCESNCNPAGVSVGAPPWTVPVVAGQWKMFSAQPLPPSDTTTRYNDQTYTLTVTATAAGYDPVVKTAILYAEHQWVQPPQNQPETTYHLDGVPACAPINDGASQWLRPTNKQRVTAGGTVTFTCSWRAPADGGPYANEWIDGTALTFVSTHQSDNPAYEPTITGSFSRASAPFDKPQPPQFQGETLVHDTSKDVVVSYTIQTTSQTPGGVYVFAFGSANGNGFYRIGPDGVLTVDAASVPSTTASSTATETTSTPSPTTSTPSPTTSSPSTPSKPTSSANPTRSPSGSPSPTETTLSPTPLVTTETSSAPTTPSGELVSLAPAQSVRATVFVPLTHEILTPAAAVGAGIALATVAGPLGAVGTVGGTATLLSSYLIGLWNTLLEVFGLRRRRYPWGTVFDVATDRPVELAIVRLTTTEGRLLETRVTDRAGRFGFLAKPGTYQLAIQKPGYELAALAQASGSRYQPVWNGKPLHVSARDTAIHVNVPLVAQANPRQWSPARIAGLLHRPVLLVTLMVSLGNYMLLPSTLALIVIIFSALLLAAELLILLPRGYGRVFDHRHRPLPGIVIRLLRADDDKPVATQVTDQSGEYSFLARPGRYHLILVDDEAWQAPDWLEERRIFTVTRPDGDLLAPQIILTATKDQQ